MNVQIILSEEVNNLGRPGDVVKVRAGYARNYLLPRKLAVEANPKNLREFEHAKSVALLKREALKQKAAGLKERIEALTLAIGARAGDQGVEVDRRRITLAEPIKQLGDFTVTVRLESEVEARLKVNVTAAGE